jgi:hypothetical protein
MWDLWWTKWRWGRFPLSSFIPPIAPQSPSSVNWGWYNKPVVAAIASGLSLTPIIIIIILIKEQLTVVVWSKSAVLKRVYTYLRPHKVARERYFRYCDMQVERTLRNFVTGFISFHV